MWTSLEGSVFITITPILHFNIQHLFLKYPNRRKENLIFDKYTQDLQMKLIENIAHQLSRSLFWDVDPETVDPDKNVLFIVERVLTRGTWEEFQLIITHYGKESVGSSATQIRYLDKKTLSFCAGYFNIPKEKFKCYLQQQLHQTHWDY